MMPHREHLWQSLPRWPIFCGLLLCLSVRPAAAATDDFLPTVVREISMVLKADSKTEQDLENRRKSLENLTNPKTLPNSDLRAVLALDSWKDLDRSERLRAVDATIRESLIKRFDKWVTDVLNRPGAEARDGKVAAIAMIGSMGITMYRAVGDKKVSLAAQFAPNLEALLKDTDPAIRELAALSLGQINPPPETATKALNEMLRTGTPRDRRAAAAGLMGMMNVLVPLIMNKSSQPVVEVGRAEAVQIAQFVTVAVNAGLTQENQEVRRFCLETIFLSATLLGELGDVLARDIPPSGRPPTSEEVGKIIEYRKELARTLQEVEPLSKALAEQVPAINRGLAPEVDPRVRFQASRAMSAICYARQKMLPKVPLLPGEKASAAPRPTGIQLVVAEEWLAQQPGEKQDVLTQALRQSVGPLSILIQDRNALVATRLDALESLVTLGPLAAPATDATINVLNDPNPFIRWAAIRVLGKIGTPEEPRLLALALKGLIRRLDDTDIDVRKATNTTLSIYGTEAAPASTALAEQVSITDKAIYDYLRTTSPAWGTKHRQEEYGDAEVKLAAMRTLTTIGINAITKDVKDPTPIVLAVCVGLRNRDVRVREAAAMTLAQFGPPAIAAVPYLKESLLMETAYLNQEPEQDRKEKNRASRQAMSDALLAITAQK
jgi:HEAT repeat protein